MFLLCSGELSNKNVNVTTIIFFMSGDLTRLCLYMFWTCSWLWRRSGQHYDGEINNDDWIDMHFQQNFNLRTNTVQIVDRSKLKIGKNIMLNRLLILNRQIDFDWLNLSLNSFKMKIKRLFIEYLAITHMPKLMNK